MNLEYPSIHKLTAYLNGDLSIDDATAVRAWYNQSEETKKELEHWELIWNLSGRLEQMEQIDKQKAKEKIDSRTLQSNSNWTIFVRSFQRVAAILILPVILFSVYWVLGHKAARGVEQEFVAAYGTRTSLILSDGSKVWLNSGSKLRYERDFAESNRTVFLTGEAFFDVAANKSKPFDVVTGKFTVRAVGTEFNVFAYEGNEFETSLEKGATQVFLSGNSGPDNPVLEMNPGQRAVFDEQQQRLLLTNADVSIFSTWRDGKLSFRDSPMDDVVTKLERWFNVDIEIKNPQLLNYRYTAVFENETIQQALEMLSFSSPLKYTIVAGEKRIDGTYSKNKIEINIRN